jgi:hypothetical protein
MIRLVFFLSALLLMTATGSAWAKSYPTLQAALREMMNGDASNNNYPPAIKNKLFDCGAQAFAAGIPATDSADILAIFNGQPRTLQRDNAFKRWFGYSSMAPQKTTNPAVLARLQANARQLCPTLLQQYPEFFRP